MKKNNLKAVKRLNQILYETRKLLRINPEQNQQKIIFDMLSAVDEASFLLKEAWEISILNDIADDELREKFTNMFNEFGEIKRNINRDLRYKH